MILAGYRLADLFDAGNSKLSGEFSSILAFAAFVFFHHLISLFARASNAGGIVRPMEPGKSAYSLSVDSVFSNLDNRLDPVSR